MKTLPEVPTTRRTASPQAMTSNENFLNTESSPPTVPNTFQFFDPNSIAKLHFNSFDQTIESNSSSDTTPTMSREAIGDLRSRIESLDYDDEDTVIGTFRVLMNQISNARQRKDRKAELRLQQLARPLEIKMKGWRTAKRTKFQQNRLKDVEAKSAQTYIPDVQRRQYEMVANPENLRRMISMTWKRRFECSSRMWWGSMPCASLSKTCNHRHPLALQLHPHW